jgi:hypothetical protein
VSKQLVGQADLVYASDAGVLYGRPNAIMRQFPDEIGKMALFTSLIGRAEDIADFGEDGTVDACREALDLIFACVHDGFDAFRDHLGIARTS